MAVREKKAYAAGPAAVDDGNQLIKRFFFPTFLQGRVLRMACRRTADSDYGTAASEDAQGAHVAFRHGVANGGEEETAS